MSPPDFTPRPYSIPRLRTQRLVLEPLSWSHRAGMFALWSRAEVCRYSGEARDGDGARIALPARSPADSDRILDFWLRAGETGAGFRWALTLAANGRFVGAAGFNSLGPCAEYAYHLDPDFWGRGLMAEASRLALEWAGAREGHIGVELYIDDENSRSIALARRLGFAPGKTIKDTARRYVLPA
jgi:ribosomal-protein-alanine N-acetyltransferase